MTSISSVPIEVVIRQYIEHKEKSHLFGRKKSDAEKEYNKLLAKYSGEDKLYSLDEANKIYRTYLEMQAYHADLQTAQERFSDAEDKLKEIGRILFEATINAEIDIPVEGTTVAEPRRVTVQYANGQVMVH